MSRGNAEIWNFQRKILWKLKLSQKTFNKFWFLNWYLKNTSIIYSRKLRGWIWFSIVPGKRWNVETIIKMLFALSCFTHLEYNFILFEKQIISKHRYLKLEKKRIIPVLKCPGETLKSEIFRERFLKTQTCSFDLW